MPGALSRDHESYDHFNDGLKSRVNPLTTVDKKILRFAARMAANPVEKTHGQIIRNFGMYPPEFWMRAQKLAEHPTLSKRQKEKLALVFPDPSRPGPMGGGAPVKTDGKDFSHGVEW